MKLLLTILLITSISCGIKSNLVEPKKEVYPSDTLPPTTEIIEKGDTSFNQVEKVFQDLSKNPNISNKKKFCSFEFNEGAEPHVDVFGPSDLILAKGYQQQILKLLDYFKRFSSSCNSDLTQYKLFEKDPTFLKEGVYSIECNFTVVNGSTTDITCLIYGNNRYIFLSFGFETK